MQLMIWLNVLAIVTKSLLHKYFSVILFFVSIPMFMVEKPHNC